MTLLLRGHVAFIIITYFCTRKSQIKDTAIPDKDNVLAMLSLYLSLVVFQLEVCFTACVTVLSSQ